MNALLVPIRDLHARTGYFVRKAATIPVIITDNGKPVAELRALEVTKTPPPITNGKSYWANRKMRPGFRKLMESGALKPQPGERSIDEILDEVRADSTA